MTRILQVGDAIIGELNGTDINMYVVAILPGHNPRITVCCPGRIVGDYSVIRLSAVVYNFGPAKKRLFAKWRCGHGSKLCPYYRRSWSLA